jgi:hypothetical protein
MGYPHTSNISETEVRIQAAILAYKNKQFSLIHAVTCYFKVPYHIIFIMLYCWRKVSGPCQQNKANSFKRGRKGLIMMDNTLYHHRVIYDAFIVEEIG